jgi:hypothetical protein
MREDTFKLGLRTLCAQLPYGKNPKDDELKFLWALLPDSITGQITDQMWAYAVQQRLMDPAPDDKLPIFQQVLRHLYRLRDGMPEFAWGLREDLPERMASPHRFHSLTSGAAAQKPPELPPVRGIEPESREQRKARIMALAASVGIDLTKPPLEKADEPAEA